MKILQLTDLHIMNHRAPAFRQADSYRDLQMTIDYILRSNIQPDTVVVTGDVSSDGSVSSYMLAKEQLLRLDCPLYVLPGNHDNKENMRSVFGQQCHVVLYEEDERGRCVNVNGVHFLLLDSVMPGDSAGGMGKKELEWIERQLPIDPQQLCMVWMHHFPFCTGYGMMDEPFANGDALLSLLKPRRAYVCSGHIHAGIVKQYGKTTLLTCPAVSMLMELDLSLSGGDRFYTAQCGFILHVVEDGEANNAYMYCACL